MEAKVLISTPFGDDIDVKSGRVISSRNMGKLRQAFELLTEVIESADGSKNKINLVVSGDQDQIAEAKELLQPILEYYGMSMNQETKVLIIEDADYMDEEAMEAIVQLHSSIAKRISD